MNSNEIFIVIGLFGLGFFLGKGAVEAPQQIEKVIIMSEPLSKKLKDWRAERPDEWKMDEFIRDAEAMEKQLQKESFANSEPEYNSSPEDYNNHRN
jgi:hypothetical protein